MESNTLSTFALSLHFGFLPLLKYMHISLSDDFKMDPRLVVSVWMVLCHIYPITAELYSIPRDPELDYCTN